MGRVDPIFRQDVLLLHKPLSTLVTIVVLTLTNNKPRTLVLHVLENPHPCTCNVEIGSCVIYRFNVIFHKMESFGTNLHTVPGVLTVSGRRV